MEYGKVRRIWTRWPAIIGLLVIAGLGGMLVYWGFNPETVMAKATSPTDDADSMKWFFFGVGGVFLACGLGFGIEHYFNGDTFVRKIRCPLDELDQVTKFDNGLLVVLDNWSKLLTYNTKRIEDRGYVKITKYYNRKGKARTWHFMVD